MLTEYGGVNLANAYRIWRGEPRPTFSLGAAKPLTFRTQSRTHFPMKTLSSTDLRANFSSVRDRVNDDHEPVIVIRAMRK